MRLLLVLALGLALGACSLSPKLLVAPPPAPKLTPPSPNSMADCEAPVQLQKGPATQQQVEIAWGVDVDHLVDCRARHRILANYIRKRDARLAGIKP